MLDLRRNLHTTACAVKWVNVALGSTSGLIWFAKVLPWISSLIKLEWAHLLYKESMETRTKWNCFLTSLCLLVSLIFFLFFSLPSSFLMHRLCSLSVIVPEGNWFAAGNIVNTQTQSKIHCFWGMEEYLYQFVFGLDSWTGSCRQPDEDRVLSLHIT